MKANVEEPEILIELNFGWHDFVASLLAGSLKNIESVRPKWLIEYCDE